MVNGKMCVGVEKHRLMVRFDPALTDEVMRKEDEVNALQVRIDEASINLIATQQPVGKDVRLLSRNRRKSHAADPRPDRPWRTACAPPSPPGSCSWP